MKNQTETEILKLADAAVEKGQHACAAQIAGLEVVVHVPDSRRYETAAGHARFLRLRAQRPGPRASFSNS